MRWRRPRRHPPPRSGGHRDAMAELDRKDAEVASLVEAGDAQVLQLLGTVDRFSAEVAAVITGHEER